MGQFPGDIPAFFSTQPEDANRIARRIALDVAQGVWETQIGLKNIQLYNSISNGETSFSRSTILASSSLSRTETSDLVYIIYASSEYSMSWKIA